jgi:acyl-CoA hydrolase
MDRVTQADEIRKLLASPDYMVGSAHAVTEDGSLLFGSFGGSQLGPYVSGAAKVVLVVGSQKIVPNVTAGLSRLQEYSLVLESERLMKVYKIPSALNNILIVNASLFPGRLTVILVRRAIGF